jgi:predicted flap endonuclease-1-like 5' DNA nuclease
MKQILFSALIAVALCVWAQAPQPAAKDPAKPSATKDAPKAEAMKEAAKPAPSKQAAVSKKPRRWNEDARHCLERGSTTEIIKCAEEYL